MMYWISGRRVVQRKGGLACDRSTCYDASAAPAPAPAAEMAAACRAQPATWRLPPVRTRGCAASAAGSPARAAEVTASCGDAPGTSRRYMTERSSS